MTTPQQSLSELASSVNSIWTSLKQFTVRYHKVVGAILLLVTVPDWIFRGHFLYDLAAYVWPFVRRLYNSSLGRLLIMLAGIALIFVPWNRLRPTYDLSTLRGRTLKLRDDMQSFLDSTQNDERLGSTGIIPSTHIERAVGHSLRVTRLHCGYNLRFADAVKRTIDEFGERGINHRDLTQTLDPNRQVNNEDFYRLVTAYLEELATLPEADA